MRINLQTTIISNNQNKNKYNTQTVQRSTQSNLSGDNISFKGFDSRVQAKKPSGLVSKAGWWWSGEDKAREEVEREMRNEINALKKKVAAKEVELDGLRETLDDLYSSHIDIQAAKKSEFSALEDTKNNNNSTIKNLEETIKTKDTIISEQENTNQKLKEILDEQDHSIEGTIKENNALQRQRSEEKIKSELKLQEDLNNQKLQMQVKHESEMDKLVGSINDSVKTIDPVKRMINVPTVDGFKTIAGYNDQKNLIINHFGTSAALEKYEKPANVPNGILLFGPNGCGKTAFVNAIAGQFGCQLVEIPNALNDKENMKNLRIASSQAKELFEKSGTRTIIYIDKFDEFAPKGSRITGALKGFMDTVSNEYHCTVFATTTSPEKIDDILLRDGRFKAKIAIPPANKDNTVAILKHYASDFIDRFIDYDKLAGKILTTQGEAAFSNSQIKATIQTLNQETIMKNIAAMGSDIGKEALELFKHQIEQVKRL